MTIDTITLVETAMVIGSACAMGFGAIGAGVGEGIAAGNAAAASGSNPKHQGTVFKNMLVGQAVAESAAIFALVVAMMLLFSISASDNVLQVFLLIGAGLCMGLGALGSGIGSGFPTAATCQGIARQPAMSGKLTTNMLIGSAVCQTPSIFALVVAFILMFFNIEGRPANPTWAAFMGASLAMGLSAIGAGIGGGLVAEVSCEGAARSPKTSGTLLKTMLLGQAVAQTTSIYGMLVAFVLLFVGKGATTGWAIPAALLSAGICMGLGAMGPGVGEGLASRGGVRAMSRNAKATASLMRSMLVGMAVAESTAIYALVVSLVLIFVV